MRRRKDQMATRLCRAFRYVSTAHDSDRIVIKRPDFQYTIRSNDGPVRSDVYNSVVTFRLQCPESLNALSHEIIKNMRNIMTLTRDNEDIAAYFLDSAGKIFCSGGDVKSLYKEGIPERGMKPNLKDESMKLRKQFFRDKFTLDYMIATSKKPFVSLIEGPCIGGGVGIVTHGSHSIMTTTGTMQMPECSLGYFPDSGAGIFLGQLPMNVGMFLGLTGTTFNFEECNRWGLVTHCTKYESESIRKSIINMGTYKERIKSPISAYLFWMSTFQLTRHTTVEEILLDPIELVFGLPTVEDIILHLREQAKKAFSYNLLHQAYCDMCKMSPTSLKVTHRYLKMAKNLSMEDCFKYEYRISQNFMRHQDFYEGVRAALIDRDKTPCWRPRFLEDVTDEMVDKFFDLPDGCEDLDVVKESKIAQ